MHAELSEQNLEMIRLDLIRQGLSYEHLQDDILDHICCMLEEEMNSGKEFDSAYRELTSSIEENALKNIQHQTLLLLDKKFQKMKKTTYIMGLVGSLLTLVGVFFKTMHWPGAAFILMIGFFLVAFLFLPFYFVLNFREQAEKPKIVFPLVGFITIILMLSASIFKLMHWPGANILFRSSIAVILIGFVPLYIVQIFKKASDTKLNIPYLIMLLLGISIVVLLGRVNISKYAVDKYTDLTIENTSSLAAIEQGIELLLQADSLKLREVEQLDEMSRDLLLQIELMQNNLLQSVDQLGVSIDEAKRRDYRYASSKAIIKNGAGNAFVLASSKYRTYLLEEMDSPIIEAQVLHNLSFASGSWPKQWNPEREKFESMIIHYYLLSEFALNIALSEYIAIQDLMAD